MKKNGAIQLVSSFWGLIELRMGIYWDGIGVSILAQKLVDLILDVNSFSIPVLIFCWGVRRDFRLDMLLVWSV